jgi:protein-S-isoprenylcysteine O-methyltransferase Ste14
MSKDKIIEVATYIIVASAIWIVSPIFGKCIDTVYFEYHSILCDSLMVLLSGLLIVLLGTFISIWTIVLFKTKGQGTPNPKLPPKYFIVSGPYRFSRNPMAFGGFLVLLGQSLVYYSPSLLGIGILFGIIVYFNAKYIEEPELKVRFGSQYEEYLTLVPRFFPSPFKKIKC